MDSPASLVEWIICSLLVHGGHSSYVVHLNLVSSLEWHLIVTRSEL
mgnify:CR=1 FL=1